jgi:aspartyl-tRNA(Asn)/glutamyl-tRNA(Gln) amidotransferase subunit A
MTTALDDLPAFATVAELSAALREGRATSTSVVRRALDRIETHDPELNAFVLTFPEAALAAAAAADERRRQGRPKSQLDGIPFAAKDLLDVEGHPTRAGSKALAGGSAAATASVLDRLADAGMILVGKVQTVEFAFGSWGTNIVSGTPLNPHDRAVPRAPGGSSSGSGVAVAAGLVPMAIGTDTTGSVRNPSAMCGVVGLKTTAGLVGRGGLLPLASTFDSVGPLARSVEDAALVLAAIEGEDARDPATYGLTSTRPLETLDRGVAGMHFRIPSEADLGSVMPGVLERFRAALADLEALGATIEERPMPEPPEAYMVHAGDIMAAEAWHHLGRYVDIPDSVVAPAIRARILKGKEIDGARYQELIEMRRLRQVAFMRYMEGADAFLTPTSPITAPPLAEIDETKTPLGTFTRLVNLIDMAALSVPTGLVDGLPSGLQIAVRRFRDPLALRIGRALEVKRGGSLFDAPAGFAEP